MALQHCLTVCEGSYPLSGGDGKPPPTITSYIQGTSNIEAIDSTLTSHDQLLQLLRSNQTKAQARMRSQADKHSLTYLLT